MAMVVRTNMMALNANRQLGMNSNAVTKSLEKLSSGFRINRAGDDASGLAISEKMKAQIKGLETASANAQDGISLVQTAEGALTEVHDMLNRMVELATKSANGTIADAVDRENIQNEVNALLSEIDRISQSTNFNGIDLLNGTLGLNGNAITLGSQAGQTGAAVTLKLAAENAGAAKCHLGAAGTTQVAPSFEIDLGDLALTKGTAVSTVAIKVGNTTLTNAAVNTAAGAVTTKDIRDGMIAAAITGAAPAPAGAPHVQIGDLLFKAEAGSSDSKIKFTYAGLAATGATATATEEFTEAQADAVNAAIGKGPEVTVTEGAGVTKTGDIYHGDFVINQAVAKVTGARAGIDLELDSNLVKVGNELSIDGKTFKFVDWDGKKTLGADEIGIIATDAAADQIHKAVDQLSNKETDHFVISGSTDGNKSIHVGQKISDTDGVYDTYAKLTGIFSAKAADVGAGATVKVDGSKLKDGDTISIDGKSYRFVAEASTPAPTDVKEVVMGTNGADAVTNLKAALEGDGYTVTDNSGTLVISKGGKNPTIVGGGLTLQIGDSSDDFNRVTVQVGDMGTKGLGVNGLDVSTQTAASGAIDTIRNAINTVSKTRGDLGALQNRLEHTINNLDTTAENMTSANSRIRDTDMAKEMMNYTKLNVLTQAAQAMLAQANQQPQSILQLLQ